MAMTLRLTEEQDQALTKLAAVRGLSKQQVVQQAIDKEIQTQIRFELLSETMKRIAREDSELMKMLEDA